MLPLHAGLKMLNITVGEFIVQNEIVNVKDPSAPSGHLPQM
jgi:hypothetical protein